MAKKNGKKKNRYEKQIELKKLLDDVAETVDKGRVERTFVVDNIKPPIKVKMLPLDDGESNWRNKYVVSGTMLSIQTSQKAPTLAIGIREMGPADGDTVPISEFFKEEWDKLTKNAQTRLFLESNEYAKKHFAAEMLFEWLSKRPPEFIDALWDKWVEMSEDQEAAEKELGESSGEAEDQMTMSPQTENQDTETETKEDQSIPFGKNSSTDSISQLTASVSPRPEGPSTSPKVTVDV